MAQGFGISAEEWACRLPESLDLIAADIHRSPIALAWAATHKRQGKSLAASLFIPDVRSILSARNAAAILATTSDYDERDRLLRASNTKSSERFDVAQYDLIGADRLIRAAAYDFLSCCDMLVVRSETEAQRLVAVTGYVSETIVRAAPRNQAVPLPSLRGSRRPGGIVVWALGATIEQCALLAFALEALHVPVDILCDVAGPPLLALRAKFHTAARASDILARAAVIVDASLDDPGTALALAEHGVPLATACTSGAHEWLRPVHQYIPWDARSIFDAAISALSERAAHATRTDDGVKDIERELDVMNRSLPGAGPLVSVVIPTYNRRKMLRNALESVSNQRYRPLEIIVVNDAGTDVSDVVHDFPLARLIVNEHNVGVTPSINVGIAESNGEYVSFLADDDFLQPDHLPRLVAALEQSGCDVAHSKELVLHYNVEPGGSHILHGFHICAPRPTYPSEMLVFNRIAGPSMMLRRRVFEHAGRFDVDMSHGSDFEMWMRLSKSRDFVFVNHVTAHVSMRDDKSQLSSISGRETAEVMTRIYAKHPVSGRVLLEGSRAKTLAVFLEHRTAPSAAFVALSQGDRYDLQAR